MRILVCGGRDYTDEAAGFKALDALHAKRGITLIIEGECPYGGADLIAKRWGESRGVRVLPFHAEWKKYGRAAGPKRNSRMLEEGRPDGVVAFPGGYGTADMASKAEAAGLKVWRPYG